MICKHVLIVKILLNFNLFFRVQFKLELKLSGQLNIPITIVFLRKHCYAGAYSN